MTNCAGDKPSEYYYTECGREELLRILAKRMGWPPSAVRALDNHPIDLVRLADILTKLDQFERAAM